MKQHITKEQWDELNDEQKEKLSLSLLKPGDITMGVNIFGDDYLSYDIGKMIEFLGDDLWNIQKKVRGYWNVLARSPESEPIVKKELADALWQAVKYKLSH